MECGGLSAALSVEAAFKSDPIRRSLLPGNARRHFRIRPVFAYAAVAPLALLKFHESLEQPRAIEIRPKSFRNQNLGVGNLPQQKIADAHFPAGANQQIR